MIATINQEIKQADDELERRAREKSLLAFTHAGWRWAGEPGRFVDNWHIECMCEHLEAVANRQILRLLINVPPLQICNLMDGQSAYQNQKVRTPSCAQSAPLHTTVLLFFRFRFCAMARGH